MPQDEMEVVRGGGGRWSWMLNRCGLWPVSAWVAAAKLSGLRLASLVSQGATSVI